MASHVQLITELLVPGLCRARVDIHLVLVFLAYTQWRGAPIPATKLRLFSNLLIPLDPENPIELPRIHTMVVLRRPHFLQIMTIYTACVSRLL